MGRHTMGLEPLGTDSRTKLRLRRISSESSPKIQPTASVESSGPSCQPADMNALKAQLGFAIHNAKNQHRASPRVDVAR